MKYLKTQMKTITLQKSTFTTYLTVSILTFFVISCSQPEVETREKADNEKQENFVTTTLTNEQIKTIGIELGTIEKKQLTTTLTSNGYLKVPNQNRASISSLISGTVQTIDVRVGQSVNKNQMLISINSPSFILMQEEYLNVGSKLKFAELELKRQQELQQGNATALKNLQQSENEVDILKTKQISLKRQLEMLGINAENLTTENIQNTLPIKSPIFGAVSDLYINIGSYVEANKPVVDIIDNSQLHLDLYVYEKDLNKISVGQRIHFNLTNIPGKEYDAKIFGISNTFEENTKAVAVHAVVEGDKKGLIDGMSITALISLSDKLSDAVPNDAIVTYQNLDYIFIVRHHDEPNNKSDITTFERILVKTGTSNMGYTEITPLQDISSNAKIVTHGAFFVMATLTNKGEE